MREHVADVAVEHAQTLAAWLDEDAVPADSVERGEALYAEGAARYFLLDYARSLACAERAIRTFRAVGAETKAAETVMLIANTLFYQDRFVEAERACAALAVDPAKSPDVDVKIKMRLADIFSLRGDAERAIATLEEALAVPGDLWRRHILLCNLLERELVRGNLARCAELLDELRRASKRGEAFAIATESMELRADVVWGRFEAPRPALARHIRYAEQHQDLWTGTSLRAISALVSAALDAPDEVYAEVRAAIAAWERVHHDEPYTWWALDRLAERLHARGMHELGDQVGALMSARRAEVARAFSG